VALVAELAAFFLGFKRFLRTGRAVAFLATNLFNNRMNAGFQEVGSQRGVGIMTTLAGGSLYRITRVRFFKVHLFTVVAGDTKGNFIILEKIGLIRAMGEMTGVAGLFLQDLMNYFLFVVLLVVALVTGLLACRHEEVACLGCVRVVAVGAFSFFQCRMDYRFFKSQGLSFMAGIADLIPRLFEQKLGNDAVPQMAFLAFSLFDYRMDIFHCEVGVGKLRVTVETLLANEGSPFGSGSAGGKVNNRAQEKYDYCCQVYTVSF